MKSDKISWLYMVDRSVRTRGLYSVYNCPVYSVNTVYNCPVYSVNTALNCGNWEMFPG